MNGNLNGGSISGKIDITGTLNGTITIGGGSAPVLQEVTVRSKPGQDQTITPESGVDGFSSVKVRRTPLTTKVINPTTQSQTYHASDDDAQGYSQVTVGAMNLQQKTITPTSQQQVVTPDTGWDGMSQVTVQAANDTLDALFNDGINAQNFTMSDNNDAHTCYGVSAGINVALANTVTKIGAGAFSGFSQLKSIDAPGVTEIGNSAFTGCVNLSSTIFPAVQTIKNSAFTNISNGDSNRYLKFPALSHIETSAFFGSYKITDIWIGYAGVCTLDDKSAFNTYGVGRFTVHVPSDQLENYQNSQVWADAVTAGYITLVGDYV